MDGSFFRTRSDDEQPARQQVDPDTVPLQLWLDDLESEYQVLVQRLRWVDMMLVKHGRKRSYLLPKNSSK